MNSRRKGAQGERDLANTLKKMGFDKARRGVQYSGSPDSPDVVGIDGFHIECKRTERTDLYGWMKQAQRDCGDNVPIVVHRKNREGWLVIMTLEDFVKLIGESND